MDRPDLMYPASDVATGERFVSSDHLYFQWTGQLALATGQRMHRIVTLVHGWAPLESEADFIAKS
jgi:hypothetical protein